MQKSLTIWSEGTRLAGDLFLPDDLAEAERRPAVLLCHGWGGLKEHLSATYAPFFAKAGLVAMTFDYRGWGESESKLVMVDRQPEPDASGEVTVRARAIREVVDPFDQLQDVANCLDFLRGEPCVDTERIGLWGSSYGGGHVVHTAGTDPRIRAIVAQVSNQSGIDAPELLKRARELATAQARGDADPIPQGVQQAPGLAGNPDWPKIVRYRPIVVADRIRVPTLIIDAEHEELMDRTQHGQAVYEVIRKNATAAYEVYPCFHYEIYDKYYRQAAKRARDWFVEHLMKH